MYKDVEEGTKTGKILSVPAERTPTSASGEVNRRLPEWTGTGIRFIVH